MNKFLSDCKSVIVTYDKGGIDDKEALGQLLALLRNELEPTSLSCLPYLECALKRGNHCLACKYQYACNIENYRNPFKVGELVQANFGDGHRAVVVTGLSRNNAGMPFVKFTIDRECGPVEHTWSVLPQHGLIEKL